MKKPIVICFMIALFLFSFAVAEGNWKCPECGVRVPEYLGNICPNCGFDMLSAKALYNKGLDAEKRKDYTAAAEYYLQAADQGYALAQYDLALLYGNGYLGLDEESMKKMLKYLQLAADQGYARAQYDMGINYQQGLFDDTDWGVEKSPEKAFQYFKLAADQEYGFAYEALGNMYYKGEGVEQSYEKAAEYYRLAADYGELGAQQRLGEMYEKGEGVEQSYEKAAEYYRLAANQGNKWGHKKLESLYEKGYVSNSVHDPSVKDLSVNVKIAIYSIAENTFQRYDNDQCWEGEYQSIVFLMENNSSHSISIKDSYARVDGGSPYRWTANYVMSPGDSRQLRIWYDHMKKLSAGAHKVTFYINGDRVSSTSIELKPIQSSSTVPVK